MDERSLIFRISIWVVPLLFAVPLHEAAHGWVAYKLGDDTAHLAGRVTFTAKTQSHQRVALQHPPLRVALPGDNRCPRLIDGAEADAVHANAFEDRAL